MRIGSAIRTALVRIITTVKGNRLAVFGAKAVGKTSLQRYIREGQIVKDYDATGLSNNVPLGLHSGNDYQFYVKPGEDVGGSEDFIELWRRIFLNSDICFYLLNSHDVFLRKKAVYSMIKHHISLLNYWNLEIRDRKIPVLVIGTFADFLPKQKSLIENENEIFARVAAELEKGNIRRRNFIIGSLDNQQNAASLLLRIVQTLQHNN